MQESTDISFRPVQPSDADFLYEMFVASRERELAPLPSPMRDVLARQQYDVYRRGMGADYPDAHQLIVCAGANRAGMLFLAERPGVLWVIDLALHPERRNRGLGSAVLGRLMDTCRKSGRVLRGSVAPHNPARRLYARLGIRECDASQGYIQLEWRPG